MKKVLFALVAMVALVFSGCKVETSKVTVSVQDTNDFPVVNRYVCYTDVASAVFDFAVPSPESLVTGIPDGWAYAQTNAQGTVTISLDLAVNSLKYYFAVFDDGAKTFVTKEVTIKRGQNEEINFVVNK